MADPISIGLTAISVLSTIGQTISGIRSASANAQAAKAEAASIAIQTERAQAAERRRNLAIAGQQEATIAASGLATTSGSPLEVMMQSAFEGEMNALDIGYSGELKRQTKLREANQYKSSIPGIVFGGLAKTAGYLGNYYSMNKPTGLGPTVGNKTSLLHDLANP